MNSSDVFIMINGQSFRIDGDTLRPAENNFQGEVLKRLDGIESRLDRIESRLSTVEQGQIVMHEALAVQTSRIDMLLWGGGIAFAALAAIIAFVGIFTPKLWEASTRKSDAPKDERVNFTISLTDLLAKALKSETSRGE